MTRVALIQGHPDARAKHFGHALAEAYAAQATSAGHEVRRIEVAQLDFPLLQSQDDWREGEVPRAIAEAQQTIAWAEHLLIVFPLWLGDMPARLKGFFEQAMRPGFAVGSARAGRLPAKLLKGRSARIIVTMGMPAFFYRVYYRSHSVKSLKRNVLEFCGIGPVATTLVGTIDAAGARRKWLTKMTVLGRRAR